MKDFTDLLTSASDFIQEHSIGTILSFPLVTGFSLFAIKEFYKKYTETNKHPELIVKFSLVKASTFYVDGLGLSKDVSYRLQLINNSDTEAHFIKVTFSDPNIFKNNMLDISDKTLSKTYKIDSKTFTLANAFHTLENIYTKDNEPKEIKDLEILIEYQNNKKRKFYTKYVHSTGNYYNLKKKPD